LASQTRREKPIGSSKLPSLIYWITRIQQLKKHRRRSYTTYLNETLIQKIDEVASALKCQPSKVIETTIVAILDNPPVEAIEYLKGIDIDDGIEKISKKIYQIEK
jgi:hypothetical protein